MANQAAFESGYQEGFGESAQKRAHKQALSDQEFLQTNDDLLSKREAIKAKIPSLSGDELKKATDDLIQVEQGIRLHWHHDKNPGMLQKYGNRLLSQLKLAKPLPTAKERQAAGHTKDLAAVQSDIAAAPLSPDIVAKQKTQAEIDAANARNDATIAWLKKNNAPQEVIDQAVQAMARVPVKAGKIIPGTEYKGADGKWYRAVENADGTTGAIAMPPDYKPKPTKAVKGGQVKTKPGQSPTGWAQLWVDPTSNPPKVVGWNAITPSRFFTGTESSDLTRDPFGVTSSSSRETKPLPQQEVDISGYSTVQPSADGTVDLPNNTSAPAGAQPSTPTETTPSGSTASPAATSETTNGTAKPKPSDLKAEAASLNGAPLPTDDQGHIPANVKVNAGLREAANQLLDGVDIKELTVPARDKASAEALARQYGWGRGPYLPRELKQMQNANQFLDAVLNSKNFMKAIDEGTFSKTKIAMAEKDASKDGLWGTFWHNISVANLSPAEQEYVRLRQSLLGTISGLSSVVRSGRPTEATINRLIQEIPDVMSSKNSKDAKERIANIKKELDLALKQGVPKPSSKGMSEDSSTTPKSSNSTSESSSDRAARLRKLMTEHITAGGPQ